MAKQGRSSVKCYGCIFSCLAVRAVHIEVTQSFVHRLISWCIPQIYRPPRKTVKRFGTKRSLTNNFDRRESSGFLIPLSPVISGAAMSGWLDPCGRRTNQKGHG